MSSFDKELIESCLTSPDIFEASLRRYKERYKNIEWGEKKDVIKGNEGNSGLVDQDEVSIITQYMKKMGTPVSYDELRKQVQDPFNAIATLKKRRFEM